jgi:hypothetical protein
LELKEFFAVNQIDTCEKGNRLQTDLPLLFVGKVDFKLVASQLNLRFLVIAN